MADLNLYGAASVTLNQKDENLCSDDHICKKEVDGKSDAICNGTAVTYVLSIAIVNLSSNVFILVQGVHDCGAVQGEVHVLGPSGLRTSS